MNDVASRIRRITEDLCALRNAMQTAEDEQLSGSAHGKLLNEIISTGLVTELKGALDEVRHFLWYDAELVAAKQPSDNSQNSVDRGHRRLVAEMLQSFSRSAAPLSMTTLPAMASFFERIDFVVSSRLAVEEQRRKFDRDAA